MSPPKAVRNTTALKEQKRAFYKHLRSLGHVNRILCVHRASYLPYWPTMWMSRPVGVLVFPTRVSEQIRASPALLHYQMPPPKEPPIDYETICDTPNTNDVAYQIASERTQRSQSEYRKGTPYAESKACRSESQAEAHSSKSRTQLEGLQNSSSPQRPSPPAARSSAPPNLCGRRNTDSESDEAGIEILQDLDNALEEDEQMTFEEIKEKVKRMNLTFRQYAPQSTDCVERPQNDYNDSFYSGERCRTKPSHHKRHEPYMDAEKSDKYVSNVAAPKLNEAVIGELKKMPNGINSLAQYKQEKQKEIIDKENQVRSQIENIKKEYTAEMFIDQTPIYFKGTETEIPRWKRLLMAQKIAAEAIRQREADLWSDFAKWKEQFSPNFRRSK